MSREEERIEIYRRTVVMFFVLVLLVLAFLIIRPFLIAIISAAALAYIFNPVYLLILKNFPKMARAKELSSILTCLIVLLLVLAPTALVMILLTYEARDGYLFLQDFLRSPQPLFAGLPPFLSQWSGYFPQFKEIIADLAGQFIGVLQNILKGIPNVALNIFITVFSLYYFLKHGKDLYRFFSDLVPLSEGRYKQILQRFDDLSR